MYFEKFSLTFYKNDMKILEETYKNLDSNNTSFRFNMLDYDTKLDINKKLFSRENDEYLFELDIDNQKCKIILKKEQMNVDIKVEFCELKTLFNKIQLEYMIETDDAKNKIVIEKSDENE